MEQKSLIYTMNLLGKRILDAVETSNLLITNERYYDAYIMVGHAFETCAILCYIKDCNNDTDRIERYNKYLASSLHNILYKQCLEFFNDMADDESWSLYLSILNEFNTYGESIIEKDKSHVSYIEQLRVRNSSNEQKKDILRNNYKPIPVEYYISSFMKRLVKSKDRNWFNESYRVYCGHKHSSFNTLANHAVGIDSNYINRIKYLIEYITKYMDSSIDEDGNLIWVYL